MSALFKLSYGLFILGVTSNGKKNACIVNTVQQVTAIPEKISVAVAKTNLTHDLIIESGSFAVSILGQDLNMELVQRFGMQSGRDTDKFEGQVHQVDLNNNPYIEESSALLSGKVINTVDLGSHTLFIADLVAEKVLSDSHPITYGEYRRLRANPSARPQVSASEQVANVLYECSICHYEYDGDRPFEELGEDYICPICKQPKKVFIKK